MKKNVLIKFLSVMLSVILLLSLAGCSEDKDARKALIEMFDTLKAGDYDKAISEYVIQTEEGYDFINCEDGFSKETFEAYDMHLAVFESLEYEVKKVSVVDETHTVYTVEITAIDLSPVGKELASTATAYNITAENGEDDEILTDDELNEILEHHMISISNEYLNGKDVKKRTAEIDIKMHYDAAKGWKVHMTPELADMLNGGVYTAFYDETSKSDMVTRD